MGVERKSVAMSEHERVTCAYHEAGHAVVAALLPDADPLHKVTIIPRGRALGVTMQLPEADRYTHSKPFIEAQIAILMGGRVAEELFLRQMTSGASNDIERATELAREDGVRARDVAARPGALPPAVERLATRQPRRRLQRGDRPPRRRRDPRAGDARIRDGAADRRAPARGGEARWREELLDVESVDADRLKQILAQHVLPPANRPAA